VRSGDIDGNGLADLLMAFGSQGTWVFSNNATWSPLHSLPVQDAAFADLDGNGKDDLALDFGALGLWVYGDNGAWTQLHGFNPQGLQAGRFH
jgi:VCBS repeat protein